MSSNDNFARAAAGADVHDIEVACFRIIEPIDAIDETRINQPDLKHVTITHHFAEFGFHRETQHTHHSQTVPVEGLRLLAAFERGPLVKATGDIFLDKPPISDLRPVNERVAGQNRGVIARLIFGA